jgi:cell wall-associated NlpC family hydrolase
VHTRLWGSTTLIGSLRRRGAAIPLGLLAVGALVISIISGVSASAAPQPTVAQVQARLNQLNTQFEQLVQRYDAAQEDLASASQRLTLLNREAARYLSRFNAMRVQVAQIAATAYMNGQLTSPEVLLTSGNPQQILNQASMLTELSSANAATMSQFLGAARQLTGAQQAALRTKEAKSALRAKLASEKNSLQKLIAQQQSLLNQLTPAQRKSTGPGGGVPTPSPSPTGGQKPPPPPPVSGAAGKAVAFAYNQLGCPYVFGGTGPPCSAGYDCSRLTQQAWAAAGIAIPRTSFEQWDSLPHVSLADIQPGDILVFNGEGHVALYVGNGMLIDALHTGVPVEHVPFAGWYQQTFDGALRP